MAKSRAILNLHYYESQIFQQIRVFYPLINNIPVISEDYAIEENLIDYKEFVFHPDGKDFVSYVKNLLIDNHHFEKEAADKLRKFSQCNNDEEVQILLESTIMYFKISQNRLKKIILK